MANLSLKNKYLRSIEYETMWKFKDSQVVNAFHSYPFIQASSSG